MQKQRVVTELMRIKVNASKFPKEKIYSGQQGKYMGLMVERLAEPDQYGNDLAIYVSQDEEERKTKAQRTYVGEGKLVWENPETKQSQPQKQQEVEADDLPF